MAGGRARDIPRELLADLVAWLADTHVRGVVIGGIAASLLGEARLTRDVDVMVVLDLDRTADFLAAGLERVLRGRQ